MKARELAAKYGYVIGCGDNSCMFGSPGGMGTNGGCRCYPDLDRKARMELRRLARIIAEAAKEVHQ